MSVCVAAETMENLGCNYVKQETVDVWRSSLPYLLIDLNYINGSAIDLSKDDCFYLYRIYINYVHSILYLYPSLPIQIMFYVRDHPHVRIICLALIHPIHTTTSCLPKESRRGISNSCSYCNNAIRTTAFTRPATAVIAITTTTSWA